MIPSFRIHYLIVLFASLRLVAQTVELEPELDDHGDYWTQRGVIGVDRGGLSVLQNSGDLVEWSDTAAFWGFADGTGISWPLFSFAKPDPQGPVAPDPSGNPTASVTFLMELAPDGLIVSWPSLDEKLADGQAVKLRRQLPVLRMDNVSAGETWKTIWNAFPIHSKRVGDYDFTFLIIRSEGEFVAPFPTPLGPGDSAMLGVLEANFANLTAEIQAAGEALASSPPPPPPSDLAQSFWRVSFRSGHFWDADGDGLTNAEELDLGTNMFAKDSDLDGLLDGTDPEKLSNAALADPDGANQDALNVGLIGRWDFEEHTGSFTPAAAVTASAPDAVATGNIEFDGSGVFRGMPSRALTMNGGTWDGGANLSIPPSFLGSSSNYTFSFWLKVPPGSFKDAYQTAGPGATIWTNTGSFGAPDVYSLMTITDRNSGAAGTPRFAWVLKPVITVTGTTLKSRFSSATSYFLALENWEPGPVATNLAGWTISPSGLADGRWHHLALVLTGSTSKAYLDGVALSNPPGMSPADPPAFNFADSPATTGFHLGSFGPYISSLNAAINNPTFAGGIHGPRKNLPAGIDRLRVYPRVLTPAEIISLRDTDIDRDELLDLTEHRTLGHADLNGDALVDPGEYNWLLNPFRFDEPTADHDLDGLVSLAEQDGNPPFHGATDPADPDSDDDGIPDGWESDNGLNPLLAADATLDGDLDGNGSPAPDGLTNLEEYLAGTDPNNPDTNGNGIPDGQDTPPMWLAIKRTADYDFDDYPNDPQAPRRIATSASWPGAADKEKQLAAAVPFGSIGSYLETDAATKQPWPANFPSGGFDDKLVAKGSLAVIPDPDPSDNELGPCYHADLDHRQVIIRQGYPAEKTTNYRALKVDRRTVNGEELDPIIEAVTLTIPQGEAESIPYELKPTFQLATTGLEHANAGYTEKIEVMLLPVEIVNADGESTGELRIGKMEGAISEEGVLNLDLDVDRFQVRIKEAKGLINSASIEISTSGGGNQNYSDGPDEVDLEFEGDDLITKTMLLVADEIDDDYSEGEVGVDDQKNDRTHLATLGGRVIVNSLKLNSNSLPMGDLIAEVTVRKTLIGRIVLVGGAGEDAENFQKISDFRNVAVERFSQVGIRPQLLITSMDAPDGVDMSSVSHDGGIGPDGILVHPDSKAIIDKARDLNKLATVTVFVVPSLAGTERGRAFRIESLASRDRDYANHVIVSESAVIANNGLFTIAHEIGHILTGEGHFGEEYELQAPTHAINGNLMRNGTSLVNEITSSKRLIQNQQELLKNSLLED